MPTVYEVPQDLLIKRLSEHLRKVPQIAPPAWAPYAKTGSHAARPPQDRDWWYTRCASLLRKVYVHGPIGLTELEVVYGGGKRIGYGGMHHRDAGGSAIRRPLLQLEAAGLVEKKQGKGRMVSNKGRSLLDRLSNEIFKELIKSDPSLARYS
ncbi:MAG: 30S ribosomal protein S19e [Thaumarchaeota archaeon]|nr:30S ribosomal protein S19e [Nitrososphaerota archaeon]